MQVIIVGAGYAGAVAARALAERGYTVELFEKREHIAGNMFDGVDPAGILCHQYGPHIFRTNEEAIWKFVSRFGSWYPYVNYTSALIDGKHAYMPFNLNAIEQFFGEAHTVGVQALLDARYGPEAEIPVLELLQSDQPELVKIASFFYEKDYFPYTQKQWGKGPKEIDPQVTARVPIRNSRDNRLNRHVFQYLPEGGYAEHFRHMLAHPSIRVTLHTDALAYLQIGEDGETLLWKGGEISAPVIYTGAVDELLQCRYGRLPYRSLAFQYETLPQPQYQPSLGVCYPAREIPYTRIIEYRHLMQTPPESRTTIVRETPMQYDHAAGHIPCYPMMTDEARAQYMRYRQAAERIPNLYLAGRLAEYRYYNMDDVIARALQVADAITSNDGRGS